MVVVPTLAHSEHAEDDVVAALVVGPEGSRSPDVDTIHLYGMANKRFHSRLFQRYIEPNEMYYWKFVYAEFLYRIIEMEEAKCSCI